VSGTGDVVSDATNGLSNGRGVGSIEFGLDIASLLNGIITAQVDGDGASDENVGIWTRYGDGSIDLDRWSGTS
jgi:hypothetical protein